MSKSEKSKPIEINRKSAIIPIVVALWSGFSTVSALGRTATYTRGDSHYWTLETCTISSNAAEPCLMEITSFFAPSVLPSLVTFVLSFALGLTLLFSRKMRKTLVAILSPVRSKFFDFYIPATLGRAKKIKAVKAKEATPTYTPKRFVIVAPKNGSLARFSSTTTQLIVFGLVLGLITFVIILNQSRSSSSMGLLNALSSVSEWLIALGALGKILIGAAKIVVEGLDGNIRERDEFSEETE